jgi:hypothetical protein
VVPGLSYRETMSGNYWRLDAPTDERAIAFTIDVHTRSLIEFARSKICQISGIIDAERLASGRELEGTISFKLLSQRRMPYRLSFVGDDGHRYELSGQREWSGIAPIESMTILPATLYDRSGDEVARATLRFDLRADWASWIKSLRLPFDGE